MNDPKKRKWMVPAILTTISLAIGLPCWLLSRADPDRHLWLDVAAGGAFMLFVYGGLELFWALFPIAMLGELFVVVGLVVVYYGFVLHEIAMELGGGVIVAIGGTIIAVKKRLLPVEALGFWGGIFIIVGGVLMGVSWRYRISDGTILGILIGLFGAGMSFTPRDKD